MMLLNIWNYDHLIESLFFMIQINLFMKSETFLFKQDSHLYPNLTIVRIFLSYFLDPFSIKNLKVTAKDIDCKNLSIKHFS